MFDENGNYKEIGTLRASNNNNSNRYTKIGNILQDYIDEENGEQNNDNVKINSELNKKNNSNKKITKYKIILLGESGVGKTSIINKYIFNKFESSTIIQDENNSDKYIKMIDIDDTKSVELSIYDTTNEKKMGKITRNYYKDAHGAIIVFDVGKKESFNKVKYWIKETNNYSPKDIIICVLFVLFNICSIFSIIFSLFNSLIDSISFNRLLSSLIKSLSISFLFHFPCRLLKIF